MVCLRGRLMHGGDVALWVRLRPNQNDVGRVPLKTRTLCLDPRPCPSQHNTTTITTVTTSNTVTLLLGLPPSCSDRYSRCHLPRACSASSPQCSGRCIYIYTSRMLVGFLDSLKQQSLPIHDSSYITISNEFVPGPSVFIPRIRASRPENEGDSTASQYEHLVPGSTV